MRASPPCQVSLQRVGVWRAALFVLVAAAGAASVAWAWGREAPAGVVLWGAVASALLMMLALGASLWRMPVQSLRWDGRGWQLDAIAGELSVALDLGPWMLLVFTPAVFAGTRAGRVSWLPFQRRGLETQWHALRCAVYSPRPAAGHP
ncbi:MAG TPA: hypothetical protein VGM74_02070 [Burkholderiaceae bacterium]|jgi:hypothetical protein